MSVSVESIRVTRLLSAATIVYGDSERAWKWMCRANPQLDGLTPLSLCETATGSRRAEELLIQIDEGMYR
jgi:uncharacterized protein (DUF2384 family)